MKVIIIDDEKKGREILQKMLQTYCKEVEIVALASNVDEAYELINKHNPDAIFLDIEMPDGNGFSLLERFDDIKFKIVFTTAHDSFAVKAIKFHALDYLLKPIDIDELKAAVENVAKMIAVKSAENKYMTFLAARKLEFAGRIGLPVKDGFVYLAVADILRIESEGSYSVFYTSDKKKYVVSKNLKEYEDILPAKEFFRAHKSHLINIKKVRKYLRSDGHFVEMEDGAMIEIARRKKDEFFQLMDG